MSIDLQPDVLAAMCFTRAPADIDGRDVVLAALWHLYIKAARDGLPTRQDRTFRHTLVGQRSGLAKTQFRSALRELLGDGLVFEERNGYGLTRHGFAAVRRLVDVDRSIALAHAA
jgi:hypothetical protein